MYWIPVCEVLDRAGFEVMLVPPRMTKQIAGRKRCARLPADPSATVVWASARRLPSRNSRTFIGARRRARFVRKDTPVAITATARELACLIQSLVTRGDEHVECGIRTFEQPRINRTVKNLGRRAKRPGCWLVMVAEDGDAKNSSNSFALGVLFKKELPCPVRFQQETFGAVWTPAGCLRFPAGSTG